MVDRTTLIVAVATAVLSANFGLAVHAEKRRLRESRYYTRETLTPTYLPTSHYPTYSPNEAWSDDGHGKEAQSSGGSNGAWQGAYRDDGRPRIVDWHDDDDGWVSYSTSGSESSSGSSSRSGSSSGSSSGDAWKCVSRSSKDWSAPSLSASAKSAITSIDERHDDNNDNNDGWSGSFKGGKGPRQQQGGGQASPRKPRVEGGGKGGKNESRSRRRRRQMLEADETKKDSGYKRELKATLSNPSNGGWSTGSGWVSASEAEQQPEIGKILVMRTKSGKSKSSKGGKSRGGKGSRSSSSSSSSSASWDSSPTICRSREPNPSPTW